MHFLRLAGLRPSGRCGPLRIAATGFRSVQQRSALRERCFQSRKRALPLMAVLIASALSSGAQQQPSLFSPAGREAVRAESTLAPDQITVRRRLVAIDFEMLARSRAVAARDAAPATLHLNLFDDVAFTGIVERTEPTSAGYALLGTIQGVELGTMTLVVNGEVVAGTVRTPRGTYRIRTAGKGVYAVSQVDLSKLPRGAEPVRRPPPARKALPVRR